MARVAGPDGLPETTRRSAFQGGGRQAVAGTPVAEAFGAAVPEGSGQRPHRPPSDQHYLSLESRKSAPMVAIALEAWIDDNAA